MSEETEKKQIGKIAVLGDRPLFDRRRNGDAGRLSYILSVLSVDSCRPPSSERPFPSYFPRRWASASGLPSTGFYPSDLCSET